MVIVGNNITRRVNAPIRICRGPTDLFMTDFVNDPTVGLLANHIGGRNARFRLSNNVRLPLGNNCHRCTKHGVALNVHPRRVTLDSRTRNNMPVIVSALRVLNTSGLTRKH